VELSLKKCTAFLVSYPVNIWTVGALSFVWAATVSLVLQFLILPYLLPAWHAGDGLLAGGD